VRKDVLDEEEEEFPKEEEAQETFLAPKNRFLEEEEE
jgi:hypothetical protein